jgi:hypothetical protein
MRPYVFMIIIVLFSFLLSLNTVKVFSLEELSLFLTVIGLIYGLISAFTINNAWERFSKIRDAISDEIYALTSVYVYSKELSDKKGFNTIKHKIIEYCREVPTIEWNEYWESKKNAQKIQRYNSSHGQIEVANGQGRTHF